MYKIKIPLVLASSSPRRHELLAQVGLTFHIVPSDMDEEPHNNNGHEPAILTQGCARAKAEVVVERLGRDEDRWFLGVDTIVVLDGGILGKPEDKDAARASLKKLSGKWHKVVTGYCLLNPFTDKELMGSVESKVLIKDLSDSEIESYISTSEPYDKAGGYAVQGIGAYMVQAINGSYTNVVGLPLCEVLGEMARLDIIEPDVMAPENG